MAQFVVRHIEDEVKARLKRRAGGGCSVVVVDRDGLPLALARKGLDHFR